MVKYVSFVYQLYYLFPLIRITIAISSSFLSFIHMIVLFDRILCFLAEI